MRRQGAARCANVMLKAIATRRFLSIVRDMVKLIWTPLFAAIALSACVGGNGGSETPIPVAVEAPEPDTYTLIGGPVGDALVESRDALREAQAILAESGFDPGPADGLMGPRTRTALEQFQSGRGIPATGTLTVDTQGALQFEQTASVRANADTVVATAETPPPAAVASATPASSVAATTAGSNTWLAFLSGKDIQDDCGSGTPDTYRFVYNAEITEHVRLYEMYDTGDGSAVLNIVVRGPTHISSDPERMSGRIVGKRSVNGLAPFERNSLISALMASGFSSSPVPAGTVLPSDGHFWIVSACRNGQFSLNAWTYPSSRWNSITFPTFLGQLDFTDVMFNPLSETTAAQRTAARDDQQAFDIHVGSNGQVSIN